MQGLQEVGRAWSIRGCRSVWINPVSTRPILLGTKMNRIVRFTNVAKCLEYQIVRLSRDFGHLGRHLADGG